MADRPAGDGVTLVDAVLTRELRRSVLRPHQPPDQPLQSDEAPDVLALAVLDGDRPVSCCLILPSPYPSRPEEPGAWQLRGMATVAGRRRRGLGALVLAAAVREAAARGAVLLWCDARVGATEFYQRHGFTPDGEPFFHEESRVHHLRMYRALA